MKFDDRLREVGDTGRHQKILVLLMSPVLISAGVHIMMTVFTMHLPDHRCADPVDSNAPYNKSSGWKELTLPTVSRGLSDLPTAVSGQTESGHLAPIEYKVSSCHIQLKDFRNRNGSVRDFSDWASLTGSDKWLPEDWVKDSNGSARAKCQSWVYDQSVLTSTIATQMNFVCKRKIFTSHALMLLMVGQMLGSALGGSAGDILGRKKVLMLSFLVQVVCNILTTWVTNIFTLGVAYLICGITLASSYCNGVTLVLEQVGSRCRHIVVIFLAAMWVVGILWVGLLAYYIRDWQYLQLAASLPQVLYFLCLVFVPESPRWLAEKGRFSEAEKILERIAKRNGKVLSDKIILGSDSEENQEQTQLMAMFLRCPPLVLRLAVILYNWFACSLTYYGLSLGVGNLSGNIYLNFCLSAVVELASYAVVVLLLERVGRKKVYCSSLLIGASACLLTVVPVLVGGVGWNWAVRALAMAGKFGVNISFITTWLHTPEMFPTALRAGATGACSSSARIGGVAASYLATLTVGGKVGNVLPQIIFGCVGLVAGLSALSLPETNQVQLPDSLEDAINMGRKKETISNGHRQGSLLA